MVGFVFCCCCCSIYGFWYPLWYLQTLVYVWTHKTSLTLPLFIEASVLSQESGRSYICVLGACIEFPSFYDISIWILEMFRRCGILFFILIRHMTENRLAILVMTFGFLVLTFFKISWLSNLSTLMVWWRLFQKRVVRTKLDISFFISKRQTLQFVHNIPSPRLYG